MLKLKAQVTEVNKALLSVSRLVSVGNRVVFDSEGSYIVDKQNGECMQMHDNGSMFLLKMWCRKGGF